MSKLKSEMKLGNYKWKLCSKCGQKYTVINGNNDEHKCDTFKCQREFEGEIKCKIQCDHCEKYYTNE